ncbi:MAG: beta-lactamase family protein [Clostridia bacterium]|nr:beta-lactamase family protein [Clostridia bacterium]
MNFKALDAYLDTFYREKSIPGVGVAVSLNGEIIHEHFAGFANVEARTPFAEDTMFNLYSTTKVSTVTAAMRLVDRGVLALDDPARKYLPELGAVTVLQEDGSAAPAKNVMRVRHLMSMSAGFTYDGDTPAIRRLLRETSGWPTTRQVIAALASEPLAFEPGAHFRYSFCHDVLAAVMEAAANMPFQDILQRELFEPLGMRDTVFTLNDEQRARLAPEYHGFDGATGTAREVVFKEGLDMGMGPAYRSGGGGLISCVRDYARLAAMLGHGGVTAEGRRLLSREAIDAMRTNQLTQEALPDFEEMGGWSKAGYGYGLGVRTLMDRERNNALSANGEFGWDGALGCYLLADPANGVGIFYAQQEAGSRWYTWHGTVRNLVYAAILGSKA